MTWRRAALPAASVAIALTVLGPLLSSVFSGGFVLTYDMVFSPRHPFGPDAFGLGSGLPRSVPADAVVAALTSWLPGDIVQKLILFGALVAGPWGAGRLVPTSSPAVRIVAAVGYGWTPYIAERLFMGQWPYLLTYACLPWIAAAGLAVRRGEARALPKLVLACVPAVLTPPGGVIAVLMAMTCAGYRKLPAVGGLMLLLNGPWLVPSLLHPGGTLSAPEGVAVFAARGENWAGPVVSVLGLGGFWNAETVPDSRAVPLVPVLVVAVVVISLLGQRVLARRWGSPPARSLLLLGAVGVVLAALATLPLGHDLLAWAVATVPGAGLLRDGQKFAALWALPLALGFALAVEAAARHLRTRAARAALLAGAALVPVVGMPDLAWGGLGRLEAVDYPADWSTVAERLRADERPGDVLALPLSAFRKFGWNDQRTQIDPAPRILPRTVVTDDTVYVGDRPIPGEDRRAAAVREVLNRPARLPGDLGRAGIGWVLVEHGTPGRIDPRVLDDLRPEFDGRWLTLYRVPGEITTGGPFGAARWPVIATDVVALLTMIVSLLCLALPAGRLTAKPGRKRDPDPQSRRTTWAG